MNQPHRPARRWLAALLALAAPALQATPVQWTTAAGGNGHWYDHVPAVSIFQAIHFDTARAAALGSSHQGMAGYLATITSPAEQAFITASFGFLVGFGATGSVWLGASDLAREGDWRWLDGPEAGQALGWTGWLPNHPVSVPDNHDLLALHINAAVQGQPPSHGWISVHSDGGALGYIVEYGDGVLPAVPEPQALLLMLAGLGALGWRLRSR
jgi:hypothetical protein